MPDVRLHAPESVGEATQLLHDYQGDARPIAGGTAVMLMLRQGLIAPRALVRLDRVADLRGITVEPASDGMRANDPNGTLRIGALTTLREVGESPLVQQHLGVLAGAVRLVGNIRVRNAATMGGNVCEADYASDPPGVLTTLNARVRVTGPRGAREVAVAELITDFYETSLASDELVTDILIPILPPATRAVYFKFVTRSAEDRPCVGVTGVLGIGGDGRIEDLRLGFGAIAGQPLRLPAVESTAHGRMPSEELFAAIGQAYADAADPVGDVRGSAAYRKQMIAVFARRALRAAQAGETGARKV